MRGKDRRLITCGAATRLAGLALLFGTHVHAATTTVWELNGYSDFVHGTMSGLSVTRDGRLILGPKLDPFYSSDQPEIWSVAQAPDGSLYLGTGNRGQVIKVDAQGKGSVIWTAAQPEIFALAVDRNGVIYAGTSPDGKVYRIQNGRATEYFSPGEPYIWALALAPDGTLYVGTGQQGKIFRVAPPSGGSPTKGELYYETGQSHVTALAFDREGRLLAGSEPNGILYRVTAGANGSPAKGFVLYSAKLPEIRTIVPAPDGSIYAAALGGSLARKTNAASNAAASTPVVTAPTTSITVTADAQAGLTPSPKPEAPKPTAASSSTVAAPASATEATGVERSAVYRILPDNTVETLWSSKEENAYDLLAEPSGTLLFLTDAQGRIYRLDPRPDRNREIALVAQTNEGDSTRLLSSPRGVLAATGNAGRLLRLGSAANSGGWFESPVHDSGAVARWGRLSWVGASRGVAFKTRTGNTSRPDATWSDWSAALTDPANARIASPNARYIQWRAEFSSAESTTTPAVELDSVTLAYLPQNSPPNMRSITVSAIGTPKPAPAATGSSASFSVTVTDTDSAVATPAGTQSQTLSRPTGQQIQISWVADDPDGDKLSYDLFFRGEEEREWKLLRANLSDSTYLLEGDVFADGRYFFRVVASDRPSNAPDQARQAELISSPVLFDNTPPEVTAALSPATSGTRSVTVDAADRTSYLRRCEYSIDAQPWLPIEAVDGLTDSPREQFVIPLPALPPGEHLIVIRVYDSAGNAGLAKVVVR